MLTVIKLSDISFLTKEKLRTIKWCTNQHGLGPTFVIFAKNLMVDKETHFHIRLRLGLVSSESLVREVRLVLPV